MKPSRLVTSGGARRHTARGRKKITKAALVGGAAAAAIAATVGLASPASAYSDETYFLDLQVAHGWTIWDPVGHVAKARNVCYQLSSGVNGYTVRDNVYFANYSWNRSAAASFVQDSATALCPWTWSM
jgi:Protein of unknown function (DUF732)